MARNKKAEPRAASAGKIPSAAPVAATTGLARPSGPWYRRSLPLSLLGAMLFFFSFSPFGLSPLGWIATLPLLILVRQQQLLGKRPYRAIWFAFALAWLAMLEGVRRPYWALYFGWFALSIYAAAYIPLFVGASRILVHRWRWPLAVAAPVVWVGLELLRGYAFSGFSVGILAHSQFRNPAIIQIADLFGQCGVSFLLIAPAAALVGLLPRQWLDGVIAGPRERRERLAPRVICAISAFLLVAASLAYGQHRLRETDEIARQADTLKVALLQSNVDVIFGGNSMEYIQKQWRICSDLTDQVREQHPDIDLVVWPESCFSGQEFDMQVTGPLELPPGVPGSPAILEERLKEEYTLPFVQKCRFFAQRFNAPDEGESPTAKPHAKFLVGTSSCEMGPGLREVYFNSAIFLDQQGAIESRYYKMHRVMFGEYIPLVDLFPILYRFTPLPAAIQPGPKAPALRVKDWVLAPNICFESTVPHLLRRQSLQLAAENTPPDAFVNVTNDGWFWGSGVQDLHLHCAIFRAVENRRPVVVSANSGFAVHCDAAGRILSQGKRRSAEVLAAQLTRDRRQSTYFLWGDIPVLGCLLTTLVVFASEWLLRRRKSSP